MHLLRDAFKNNWSSPGNTNVPDTGPKMIAKKPAKGILVVVDDEGEDAKEKNFKNRMFPGA